MTVNHNIDILCILVGRRFLLTMAECRAVVGPRGGLLANTMHTLLYSEVVSVLGRQLCPGRACLLLSLPSLPLFELRVPFVAVPMNFLYHGSHQCVCACVCVCVCVR